MAGGTHTSHQGKEQCDRWDVLVYFSCQMVHWSIMDDHCLEKKKKNYITEQIPVVYLGANLSCFPYNVYILELLVHLEPMLSICPTQPLNCIRPSKHFLGNQQKSSFFPLVCHEPLPFYFLDKVLHWSKKSISRF